MTNRGYHIKAVIFDFDGTLTLPGALDFPELKTALKCPQTTPVLEFIEALTEPRQRQDALDQLLAFELRGAVDSRPNPEARDLVQWIRGFRLKTGIITRNSRASVLKALENFPHLTERHFDLIISRDDPVMPKPSGEGIIKAADQWKLPPPNILMVGDFLFDIQAGADAGALTALLDPDEKEELADAACDFRIRRLADLRPIIREGLVMEAGKLPNSALQAYLQDYKFADPSVIINAGVGEDTAAVNVTEEEVLILKSDPITFATDAIGQYAVIVNANDIVTAGAVPRWFLTTLLLPSGTTLSQVRSVMQELARISEQWGITLCGGHTEISDAVSRPLVIGMMAGTVMRDELIEKKNMRTGDAVLMTKTAAVEGTAIIAREFADRLMATGFSEVEIDQCKAFLNHISIIPEARLAAQNRWATAMHDVTEGGVATALEELSMAGGHKISVELDKIPVAELTGRICAALTLDPLGLIGSGSLLICCRSEHCERLVAGLKDLGVEGTVIGKVLGRGQGVEGFSRGRSVSWPRFEVDEITGLFR